MLGLRARLARILGGRAFLAFGLVTLLTAGLLAAINLASHYALNLYIQDQLSRLPWDVALYQTTDFSLSPEVSRKVKAVEGIREVGDVTFLRTKPPPGSVLEVDGKPLGTPWISILSATDPSLFPPEARPSGDSKDGAILALIGPEKHMGRAFLALQGTKRLSMKVGGDGHHGEEHPVHGAARSIFDLSIRSVVRLERAELNRHFMDQVGSISFIPYIGVVLVMPENFEILRRFDLLSRGALKEHDDIHVTAGEYLPEVVHLARVDRKRLISGWDIQGSRERLRALNAKIERGVRALGPTLFVDNTVLILLERMYGIVRLIGVATLLIALPLLAIAWLLASNLSGLLILNERRKLGLLRLRGVPGRLMGQSLLITIGLGGLLGGVLGIILGTALPLLFYEGRWLPWAVITRIQNPLYLFVFLGTGVLLALLVSRRLVRYATTISPLEASRRVTTSEAAEAGMSFSYLQWICLILGAYKILGQVLGYSLADTILIDDETGDLWRSVGSALITSDKALNFVGLPLFVYGIVTLLISRRRWVEGLFSGITGITGGRLKSLSLKHMSLKPHRISGFLLIVALMASVSLYPSIASKSFEDRAVRAATIQVGSQLHLTLSPLDLVDAKRLEGSLGRQVKALREALKEKLGAVSRQEGLGSLETIIETLLPGFFYPGYGLSGVPLYLIQEPDRYLKTVYYEEPLGLSGRFEEIIRGLGESVTVSPSVAGFWRLASGDPILLGADIRKKAVLAPTGGVIGFFPGMPPRSITDRQSYVTARIDYLNHLTSNDAYLATAWDNPTLAGLKVFIPRVLLLVRVKAGAEPSEVLKGIVQKLGIRPLEVRELKGELKKVGGDMFIFLALENMRIYLVGGLLLALIATLAVALTNYLEDRRTLALLRVRGASPILTFRFFSSSLISPALVGLVIGALVAGVAGYGLTNVIWDLRQIRSVVHLLPSHLVVSGLTVWITLGLFAAILGITVLFSIWVFRRTTRETLTEE